ncbi:heavy metal sensor histidine kinase [Herbaspirillum rhizosphaerae]|uniref:heavy metal sensor histidine kinase n=1 Tax=Herbaspirillum rhizosphaerae TaxID=346179 RepID=UPI00067B62AA|nr:heavy metal sensor histidine kinase [Herbaspirillum rhizosphaerae]
MKPWRSWTLAFRVSALFALIACLVVTGLGMYLYNSARQSLEIRADYTLIGRVEHFRNLLHDLYNVEQMEQRPALFESMLGNEQDVRIFRRQGDAPFININPDNLTPPPMTPVAIGMPLAITSLHDGMRADGVRVRWVAALADVGNHNDTVEIVAAYVMTQESRMMTVYLWRVVAAVALTVLLTAVLGFAVLRRDLMPLTRMSRRAAEITPTNLSTRLREEDAPAELRQLASALNAMLDRLENGYEHLSQFSADLAHEIRTPVNILMGQTQVTLGKRRNVEEYEQLLESNLEELTRLSRIIENILFLAQADHADLSVDSTPIALADELHKIADYFEGVAAERDMQFEVTADQGIACRANLIMWRRAVSNLVVNAVRYGEAGTAIRIRVQTSADGVTIAVENRGAAMTQQQMERMFDRFYRGDKSRSEYTESNGLGLAIVKAIMTLHGGTAAVACTGDGWISFSLFFPDRQH